MPSIYTPKRRPRAKQAEAMAKCGLRENFALMMSQRVGKTKCVADDYGALELAGKVQNLMVIGLGGNYEDWEADLREDFSFDLDQRVLIGVWRSNCTKTQTKAFEQFMAAVDRPRVLLMNIEALSSVDRARDAALAFLKSAATMLAIDESLVIGNPTSARTKFINGKLADLAAYRRILCGLPTPRDPLSLFSQYQFLDWRILGFRSFFAFRARYAILQQIEVGGRLIKIVKGFRDLDDLYRRTEPHTFRCTLADCYDAPPKQYAVRKVSMTTEQARLYKEMKAFATAQLSAEAHVTATIVMVQMLRLHEILCGHTTDEMGRVHEIPENRTKALIEQLDDYDGKAVIWACYTHDILKIKRALEKHFGEGCCALYYGGNKNSRLEEEASFKNDASCRFMVATPDAASRGKEWSHADLVIHYSQKNDLNFRAQAEDRTQAAGKMRPVSHVDLMVEGTVDEKFLFAMKNKIVMSNAVMGAHWREWVV